MKAAVAKIAGRYWVIGLNYGGVINGVTMYEKCYLYSFRGKTYKTAENAKKALIKNGFEYLHVKPSQLVCPLD